MQARRWEEEGVAALGLAREKNVSAAKSNHLGVDRYGTLCLEELYQ